MNRGWEMDGKEKEEEEEKEGRAHLVSVTCCWC